MRGYGYNNRGAKRPTRIQVSRDRELATELAVARKQKMGKGPSYTLGPRQIVIMDYEKNKEEYGDEQARKMAYEQAKGINTRYNSEIVDRWIKEEREKQHKDKAVKVQGDDDDAR